MLNADQSNNNTTIFQVKYTTYTILVLGAPIPINARLTEIDIVGYRKETTNRAIKTSRWGRGCRGLRLQIDSYSSTVVQYC